MSHEPSHNFVSDNNGRDSGISSFSSDCNESSNFLVFNFDTGQDTKILTDKINDDMLHQHKTYKVTFLGEQKLSRRHTPYMIPWIVEEIKENCDKYPVIISITNSTKKPDQTVLKASLETSYDQSFFYSFSEKARNIQFEHHINSLTRFSKLSQNPNQFSYLFRDSPESAFTCFVFEAIDESVVNNIFYAIHNAMLNLPLIETTSPLINNSAEEKKSYNVIYIGKIVVATKKATPSFIDEAVKKFQELSNWEKLSKDFTNYDDNNCSEKSEESFNSDAAGEVVSKNLGSKTKMTCILETQDEDLNSNDEKMEQKKIASEESDGNKNSGNISVTTVDSSKKSSSFITAFESFKLKSLLTLRSLSVEGKKDCENSSTSNDNSVHGNKYVTENTNNESCNEKDLKPLNKEDINVLGVADNHEEDEGGNSSSCLQLQLLENKEEQDQLLQGDQCNQQHKQWQKKLLQQSKLTHLVVDRDYVSLCSSQQLQPLQEWKFKNITFCSQGVIYSNHFGFIARSSGSSPRYTCYIFKCPSESIVDEMMMTMKGAFQQAIERYSRHLVICELCPMHQLHKLCLMIENKNVKFIHNVLSERLRYLEHYYKLETYCEQKPSYDVPTIHDMNVNMMSCLLKLCDKQQQQHVHINDNKNKNNSPCFLLFSSEFEQSHLEVKNQQHLEPPNNDVLFGSNYSLSNLPSIEDMESLDNSLENQWKVDECLDKVKLRRHSVPHTLPINNKLVPEMVHPPFRDQSPNWKNMMMMSNDSNVHVHTDGGDMSSGDYVLVDKVIPYDSPIRSIFSKVGSHHGNLINKNKPYLKQIGKSNTISSSSSSSLSSILSPRLSLSSSGNITSNFTQRHYGGAWQINIMSAIKLQNADFNDAAKTGMGELYDQDKQFQARSTWKKAIGDTILLIKINKKKQLHKKMTETESMDGVGKHVNYQEVTPCLERVRRVWKQLLDTDLWRTIKLDKDVLIKSIRDGVPKEMRGQIWILLVQQRELRHNSSDSCHSNTYKKGNTINCYSSDDGSSNHNNVDYEVLKKQLTTHQHAILIDLGRTFPNHPYFSSSSGPGQAALFNILKAYSVLDVEVGYCQGLSFVAGLLLLHVKEKDAFKLLKHLMFELRFRRQYEPGMVPLQVRMYQLTRMLHDSHKDLFDHLDTHQISPTLYAAPWFLTIFASQFPLGFVSRVFDMIFMHGTEVITKVAVVLLVHHKELIMQCTTFESLVEFLKVTLPDMAVIQMEKIFNQVFQMDVTNTLEAYEMEYHILHEEINFSLKNVIHNDDNNKLLARITRLQLANDSLRRQKMELLDQLQMARRQIKNLDAENCDLMVSVTKLKSQNEVLELERRALLKKVDKKEDGFYKKNEK